MAGNSRITKLLEDLKKKDEPQTQDILQEYIEKRRQDSLIRAQRNRYRLLKALKEQSEKVDIEYIENFQKRIKKLEREIEKAKLRHGALLTEAEIQEI